MGRREDLLEEVACWPLGFDGGRRILLGLSSQVFSSSAHRR